MTTITPHAVEAILHARIHLAATGLRPTSQIQTHAAAGVIAVMLVAVLIFVKAVAQVTRHVAVLLSDLLQAAAAVTSALFAIMIAVGLIAVLLLHG